MKAAIWIGGVSLLYALISLPPSIAQSVRPDRDGVVITREDIRVHGLTRIHEILWLVDDARLSTVDDFAYTADLSSLGGSDGSRWAVFVDGLPENIGAWDSRNLDKLSLPLHEIDSIRVVATPGWMSGVAAPWGRVEIWTRLPQAGLSASAMITATNETGDPGPLRYSRSELRLANVDKSGPDGALAISSGGGRLAVRASAAVLQHIPSDVAAFSRNRAAFDTPTTPELLLRSALLSVRHAGDGRSHSVSLRVGEFDDMLFVTSLAREVPVIQRYGSIVYRFEAPVGEGRMSAVAATSVASIDNDIRATRRLIRWDLRRALASVELSIRKLALGASVAATGADWRQPVSGSHNDVVAAISVGSAKRRAAEWKVSVSVDGGQLGVFAVGSRRWRAGRRSTVSASASLARILNESNGAETYWSIRGFRFDSTARVESENPDVAAWLMHVEMGIGWADGPRWIKVGVGPRIVVDGLVEERDIRWTRPAFEVVERRYGSTSGAVARISVDAGWSQHPVHASIGFRHREPFGKGEFVNSYGRVSKTSTRLSIRYVVSESMWVSGTAWYYSATTWDEYEAAAEASGRYDSRLPAFVRSDATITKGLWNNRIDFSLSFRNVFGDSVVLHPAGALLDRALSVRFRMDIP